MWKPMPSVMRPRPIMSRKPRQRIMMVGWRSTKATRGPEAMSMKATAAMTARNMMGRCCTMPTEVMMESTEKMASRMTIWAMTCQKAALLALPWGSSTCPSSRSCISMVPLSSRKTPPAMRMTSLQEKPCPQSVTKGSVSVTIHAMAESRQRRIARARPRPSRKARRRSFCGRVEARIEMKTRLSMPRTISMRTSVPRPAQADGSATQAKSQSGMCHDSRLRCS